MYNKVTNADKEQHTTYTNYVNGSVITNGKPVNTFYSYQFDKLDANGYPTFKNYNEQYLEDGDGHKKGISSSVPTTRHTPGLSLPWEAGNRI
ncbi:MAG: hypothetical protein V8R91_15610 [Butyricimonas faecihominis]